MARRESSSADARGREAKLVAILAAKLGVNKKDLKPESRLQDYGSDSITHLEVQFEIEEALGIALPWNWEMDLTIGELLLQAVHASVMKDAPDSSDCSSLAACRITNSQMSLWYEYERNRKSSAYHVGGAVRITNLSVDIVRRAVEKVLANIPVVHERFRRDGSDVVTFPCPNEPLDILELDGRDWTELMVQERLASEWNQPFDLEQDGAFRVRIIRQDVERSILLLVVHHIATDFRSLEVIHRDFRDVCDDLQAGRSPELPPHADVRASFLQWQEAHDRAFGSSDQQYWSKRLADSPRIQWPNSNDGSSDYRAGPTVHKKFEPHLTKAIRALARATKCTPFVICQATFALALARLTGQKDFCLGTSVSTRRQNDLKNAIGYFANTVLLRTRIDYKATGLEFLKESQKSVQDALNHSLFPLWRLPRAPSAQPAGPQVMFTMLGFRREPIPIAASALQLPDVELQWGDWTTKTVPLVRAQCQCDLLVTVADSPGGAALSIDFNDNNLDTATVVALAERFHGILADFVAKPDALLEQMPLLSPAELAIIQHANSTSVEYSRPMLLHVLALEGIEKNLRADAVRCHGETLTFAQLADLSARITASLHRHGVVPGDRVALLCEPGPMVVCALLGILRVGGVFVPIAPNSGDDWLATILEDIEPRVVLVDRHHRDHVKSHRSVLWIDRALDAPARPQLALDLKPDAPAYIIYTSGTTGKPKGVVVSHGAICNRLLWMQQQYPLQPDDCVLQKTPYTFDVSLWEFFLPLIAGVAQAAVPGSEHRDPQSLVRHIVQGRATIAHFVPSLLQLFLREPSIHQCTTLRRIFCSGEALSGALRDRCFSEFPAAELHNLYGPTEVAVDATYWQCTADQHDEAVPIGYPIANVNAHVLDSDQLPVPPGVIGELHLAGAGLANGYWKSPELTAERFFDWKQQNRVIRLYKTGDRALLDPRGVLHFVGRVDRQIKIGGERIELGAIEAIIRRQPQVADCAVIVQSPATNPRMIAFIVAADPSIDLGKLRAQVQRSLPSSHRPGNWIKVDRLPLTSSGKVDSAALRRQTSPAAPASAPIWNDPKEELLARLFARLLDSAPDGPATNFFELGGDSLRALQLSGALADAGYRVTLNEIFAAPTLRSLAATMTPRSREPEGPVRPFALLSKAEDTEELRAQYDDAFPLCMLQQVLVYHSQESADYETYVLRLSLRGRWSAESMQAGLARLASRHAMLRTSYDFRGPRPLQLVQRTVTLPLEIISHTDHSDAQREQLIHAMIQEQRSRKFDWRSAPFIRFRIDSGTDDRFDLTVSHPVFDGWSLMILLTELLTYVVGAERGLPPMREPNQRGGMADFVRAEQATIASSVHRNFWLARLSEQSVTLRNTGARTPRRVRREVALDDKATARLRGRAISEAVPFKSILLSIHLAVEGARGNTQRPATGLIINGRSEDFDGDQNVGLFLNSVLMGLALHNQSWRDLALDAHSAERELWPHRYFPYVELRRLAGGAPFESVFNFVHFHIVKDLLREDGLKILSWDNPSDFTFFPLAVYFVDDPTDGRLVLYLDHDEQRFSPEVIDRLAETYRRTIALASDPGGDVIADTQSAMRADTAREKSRALSAPARDDPSVPIQQLILEVIKRRATAVAVAGPGDPVTYAELGRRAMELSGAMLDHHMRPEEPICLCVSRDARLVEGMLGILLCGAAFVPLNPSDATQRQHDIIAQVGAKYALCERGFAQANRDLIQISPTATSRPRQGDATMQSLAFIVATSGSTGSPKAVEVEHLALCNTLLAFHRLLKASQEDHWLCLTPVTFDIAILELLLPLLSGATMTLVSDADLRDGARLREHLESTPWTITQGTPSTFRLAIEAGWRGKPHQRILCGGEMLTRSLADQLLDRVGEVWNCYGPCEAAIWATAGRVVRNGRMPDIGVPIANTEAEIHGENGQPVAPGVTGEIVLIGAGLARGYRNDPTLTAERFPTADGRRIYRTGDLGRWTLDGKLECLGRMDRQFKLRGFRVEPAEIEAAILTHHAVSAAAVVLHHAGGSDERLIAFVVLRDPESPQSLGEYLTGLLPPILVPPDFRPIAQLPLTPHGKIDYRSLAALAEAPAPAPAQPLEPPVGELETRIARIWAEALNLPAIGRQQNFFNLGGDSLRALQTSMRIETETGLRLPPTAVFRAPTVAGLAQWLSGAPDPTLDDAVARANLRVARQRRRSP